MILFLNCGVCPLEQNNSPMLGWGFLYIMSRQFFKGNFDCSGNSVTGKLLTQWAYDVVSTLNFG